MDEVNYLLQIKVVVDAEFDRQRVAVISGKSPIPRHKLGNLVQTGQEVLPQLSACLSIPEFQGLPLTISCLCDKALYS